MYYKNRYVIYKKIHKRLIKSVLSYYIYFNSLPPSKGQQRSPNDFIILARFLIRNLHNKPSIPISFITKVIIEYKCYLLYIFCLYLLYNT